MSDNLKPNKGEREEQIQKREHEIAAEDGGGNGYKKKGGESASTRWGEEWFSTKDVGQHPERTRKPGDREKSDFDDNTTGVGQVGDRQNLGGAQRYDPKVSSGGREEENVTK